MKQFAGESWKLVRMITGALEVVPMRPMVSFLFGYLVGPPGKLLLGKECWGLSLSSEPPGEPRVVTSFNSPLPWQGGRNTPQDQTQPVFVHP